MFSFVIFELWQQRFGAYCAPVFRCFGCFVCFPAALCSDNLPRCPTFLLAGSFTHPTRRWISEMWWRLKAALIAWLTSGVLPKCMNLPPSPKTEHLYLCNVKNRLHIFTVPGWSGHGPCHLVTPHTEQTHTQTESWPDCVPCMLRPGGLRKLERTHVAGEGQQTVGGSGPQWETLGVRQLLAHKSGFILCFLHVCAAHDTKTTQNSEEFYPRVLQKLFNVD